MYYLLISSVTYFLAFVWPEYGGWLGLFSLWILAQEEIHSLSDACVYGFVWGIVFFSTQFLWVLVLLIQYSHAIFVIKLSVWLLFILYLSFFSTMWFLCWFGLQTYISKIVSFILSTTLFFIGVYWGSGIPWGIAQNPLCDFAQPIIVFFKAWFVYQYIPEAFIFLGVSSLPFFVVTKSYNEKIMSIMILSFFIFYPQKQDSISFQDEVYHWKSGTLCQAVVQARNLGKNIVVGCEGMLQRQSELEVLPQDMILLCGAYYFYEDRLYDNCAVCLHNGQMQLYQKKFLVPYVEQAQTDLFLQSCCQKQKGNTDYFIVNGIVLQPVICSDLYFGMVRKRIQDQDSVLLFFTSHQMLCFHFIKNVLRNFIKKQKYILQVCIVCVSNEEWYVV